MADKQYPDANSLYYDSFRLAAKIMHSGFRPNFIVALWRSGTPIGCVVQEYLEYHQIETDHIAIRTSSYEGIEKRGKEVRVHALDYIVERANAEDRLLLVDDVFDTGKSITAVINELGKRCRKNLPQEIKIATVYYKPKNNLTEIVPDYYIHETDKWLVFPHELVGLTKEEITRGKGQEIGLLLKKI